MNPILDAECIVCGPVTVKKSFKAIDRLYGIQGEYTYAKCPICGILFNTTPIPIEKISELYPESYSPHLSKEDLKITGNTILYFLLLPWTIFAGFLRLSDIMAVYCIKEDKAPR